MSISNKPKQTRPRSAVVLAPLAEDVVTERELRRLVIVAGAAAYLVVAANGLKLFF